MLDFVLLGALLGLSYLGKETLIFLIPALWLHLLSSPQRRWLLRDLRWYVAHAIALLVVLPDVVLNLTFLYEGYLFRDTGLVTGSRPFAPRAVVLYLGEITQLFTAPRGGYASNFATQNPAAIHWPAGLLYLSGVCLAVRRWADESVRLLLVVFGVVFAAFTLLPGGPGTRNLWWWASLSVIPAIACAGQGLAVFVRGRRRATKPSGSIRWRQAVVAVVLLYLGARAGHTALRPGVGVERESAAEMVHRVVAAARAQSGEELLAQEWRLVHVLHVAGASVDESPELYAQLARAAALREQDQRARYFVNRSLQFDATNAVALDVQRGLDDG